MTKAQNFDRLDLILLYQRRSALAGESCRRGDGGGSRELYAQGVMQSLPSTWQLGILDISSDFQRSRDNFKLHR